MYAPLSYFVNGKVNLGSNEYGSKITPRDLFGTNNYFERDIHILTYKDEANKFKVNASYANNEVDGFTQPAGSWDGSIDFNFSGDGDYTDHPSEVYNIDLEKAWENIGKHTIVAGASFKKESKENIKTKWWTTIKGWFDGKNGAWQ